MWALYRDNNLLTARRLTEQLLDQYPTSIMGHYGLGNVYREAEGQLAKSMYHLGKSREYYEQNTGVSVSLPDQFHRELLNSVQITASDLELFEYQLQVLDYHDSLFDPNLTGEHAWPLMKLGRYDDARTYARAATKSSDDWQKTLGLNVLCAIAAEERKRQEYARACDAALEHSRTSKDVDVNVNAYNASLAALGNLEFDRAETLAWESNDGGAWSTANPHVLLAAYMTSQGRGEEAVQALRNLQSWRARQPPHLRPQSRAEGDAVLAGVLVLAGESGEAMRVIDRAIQYPDRRASTTGTAEQAEGGHALYRLMIRRVDREREAEDLASTGVFNRYTDWSGAIPDSGDWTDQATVRRALTDPDVLEGTIRPYQDGGLSFVYPWMVGDLIDVLGPGVVATAVRRMRFKESLPGVDVYFDAYDAEVAWRTRRWDEARTLAEATRASLPKSERLLRARLAAIAADSAWNQWDTAGAMALYEEVMRDDPGVMRRLGLALPARVNTRAAGAAARDAGAMIARSPRITSHSEGFMITVEGTGQLSACLRSPAGNLIFCEPVAKPRPELDPETGELEPEISDWDYARLVHRQFHDRAFAMPLGLSRVDLRSLDGTTTVGKDQARERMKGLLDDLSKEP